MDFYYVNSNGRKIDFTKPPYLGVMSNNLFEFKWDYITQGQAVQKIVKFEKYMKEKTFQVVISGNTDKEYRENLDKFLQLTDVDINNLQMGRLYVGDYFLDCYIFASGKKKRYVGTLKTMVDTSIICENGNWQSEEKWSFRGGINSDDPEATGNGILYPYDYNYDYSAPFTTDTIINESYMDTDFEIVFYGNEKEPQISIGGNLYHIQRVLNIDDYLTINSKKKTAIVTKYNGQKINVFNDRDRDCNLFEKIKGGGNLVLFEDEDAAVDVTLFYERSEPFWGDQKWI